jgi:tetratricopeptide (TPR) repeat protein
VGEPEDATAAYAAALRSLHEAAGAPTGEMIRRQAAAQVPPSKVAVQSWSDWYNGRNVPSRKAVATFLIAYLRGRAGRETPDYVAPSDDWWERTRLRALAQRRSGNGKGGRPLRRHPALASGQLSTLDPADKPVLDVVAAASPLTLGVHKVVPAGGGEPGTGPVDLESAMLPVYLTRPHDEWLRGLLSTVAASDRPGGSRLVVLTGSSSVGKTRALWEAIRAVVPDWQLAAPAEAAELIVLLKAGHATPGTVLWLNETQCHLAGPDGQTAARLLRKALHETPRLVAVGAMWERPYWEQLTSQGAFPDAHADARDLLTGPHADRIAVPDHLDADQRRRLANLNDSGSADVDRRLTHALAAGATDGRVIQHLTGGPDLLDAYRHGHLFTPVEHALITAAIDARRLGHTHPIPAALLTAAADGYLAPCDRPADLTEVDTALTDLAHGQRADGTRADIRHTLTALTRLRAQTGDTPSYDIDDYLLQHAGHQRAEQIPPSAFWAAATYADPGYLKVLGDAARARGLYRDATRLYKTAVIRGEPYSAATLVDLLHVVHPADHRGAEWAAEHVTLDDPATAAGLLRELRTVGADEQVTVLLARDPATHAALSDPKAVAGLLRELRRVGADDQVTILLARDPAAHVTLDDPLDVTGLLYALRQIGADDQATALAERAIAHVPLYDPDSVTNLVRGLHVVGAEDQMTALLARDPATRVTLDDASAVAGLLAQLRQVGAAQQATALAERAAHVHIDRPSAVLRLLTELRQVRADEQTTMLAERLSTKDLLATLLNVSEGSGDAQVAALLAEVLLARHPATHVALDDPNTVARLLEQLRNLEADEQLTALLARDPATHVALDDPLAVARLLEQLRKVGANEQATALAERAATHIRIRHADALVWLLKALWQSGANDQARTLIERTTSHVSLEDVRGVSWLLDLLWEVGADEQATDLVERAAAHVSLIDPQGLAMLLNKLRFAGLDGQAAVLAERAAAHSRIYSSRTSRLLKELRDAGATTQVATLTRRAPATGHFDLFIEIIDAPERFRFGREPDGSPAAPWTWQALE